jgi:hypothetical protein
MASGTTVMMGDTMRTYWPDTLRNIIQSVTTKGPIAILSLKPDYWHGWARGSTRSTRSFPDTLAKTVSDAFLHAIRLSQWASARDLFQIDPTYLDFVAYDPQLQTNIEAYSFSASGSVSSALEDLSLKLYLYSKAKPDTSVLQLQTQILALSSKLRALCASIEQPLSDH